MHYTYTFFGLSAKRRDWPLDESLAGYDVDCIHDRARGIHSPAATADPRNALGLKLLSERPAFGGNDATGVGNRYGRNARSIHACNRAPAAAACEGKGGRRVKDRLFRSGAY